MDPAAAPSLADLAARLNMVLTGDASRASVAAWAAEWMAQEPSPISDPKVWQLLRLAASLDLRNARADGRYGDFLHSDADIRDWIDGAG